jgi:DNA polymerase
MPNEVDETLKQVREYLEFQIDSGLRHVLSAAVTEESRDSGLEAIRKEMGDCRRCRLCEARTNIVFGEGDPDARLMFIGEGPGRDEDAAGRPFVGRAGQLLTKMIAAMGLDRSNVYIANIVKCRPPKNRDPEEDEVQECIGFLHAQIEAIQPEAIITLGKVALKALFGLKGPMGSFRGKFHELNGIPVMPTFHPSFLLRQGPDDRKYKGLAWDDLKQVMSLLNLPLTRGGE